VTREIDGKLFVHREELIIPVSDRIEQQIKDDKDKLEPCLNMGKMYAGDCPDCKRRVIYHCPECKQKVSGCSCSLGPKLQAIKDELSDRLFR